MSIDFSKAAGVHDDALRLRAERTKVLASNIANVSTPGYQARDMDFAASLTSALGAGDGFAQELPLDTSGQDLLYRVPYHPSQDGNTVELGVEQASFAQNALDFQTSLTFVNMKLKGLAKAIDGQ
ncbi:flagellar basal body rod protein FlgB [Roseateles terrae]|uniref:Flagellar basal body rod protein FlgB n=1 Tax=Roseateles terrae TaxID=431060 RepID=A0ABR6GQY5_9BURK|nr:flagellar basal body rod protein FlgB [Roseateles terrae]MBB3194116.1 flagellar basal-body rod protein FlgB [Roseateles terrae]OWQ88310.1 flagellar basal body rod protein FlgB [Roseateles terrae]